MELEKKRVEEEQKRMADQLKKQQDELLEQQKRAQEAQMEQQKKLQEQQAEQQRKMKEQQEAFQKQLEEQMKQQQLQQQQMLEQQKQQQQQQSQQQQQQQAKLKEEEERKAIDKLNLRNNLQPTTPITTTTTTTSSMSLKGSNTSTTNALLNDTKVQFQQPNLSALQQLKTLPGEVTYSTKPEDILHGIKPPIVEKPQQITSINVNMVNWRTRERLWEQEELDREKQLELERMRAEKFVQRQKEKAIYGVVEWENQDHYPLDIKKARAQQEAAMKAKKQAEEAAARQLKDKQLQANNATSSDKVQPSPQEKHIKQDCEPSWSYFPIPSPSSLHCNSCSLAKEWLC